MTAEELRIGNYVSTGNGVAYSEEKVTSIETFVSEQFKIGFNNRIDVKYYCDDIKPIPLTEQWLLDFGFEKSDSRLETHLKKGIFNWYSSLKSIVLEFDGGIADKYYDFFPNDDCNKVHQLQNLYFALTGEELTIKEKANGSK